MRSYLLTISILVLIFNNSVADDLPVIVEAESGTLGANYSIQTEGDVTFIFPDSTLINAGNPANIHRIASYTFNFTDAGTYKLFARVKVGPENFNDDSFFYGNGFDEKNPTSDDDWIFINGLATAGFTISNDVVEGQGDAATEVWKWISLSDPITSSEAPITFTVEEGELTRTFQIGSRENGLFFDKIAFGKQGIYYTVDNLDNGEAGSVTPPGQETAWPPLAYGQEKFLGCGFGPDSKRDFAGYWNQITPGNAGKWGSVERSQDNMSWGELDEAYQLAKDSGFFYRHHVLVWGNQQPQWIGALDSAEQRAEIIEWFYAVAGRYPDIEQVEVVNEPLHDPPDNQADPDDGGYYQALGGEGETGWDWVIEAFRIADTIFPDSTMLLINDYGIMNDPNATANYLEIIRLLQQDTLVDAIGFQGHGFNHNAPTETILRNIDSLAATGLPIYVTEFDVDGLTDRQQVQTYMRLFPLFWEHPAIKGITLWGFRPGMWRTDQGAFLIDAQGVERPAMLWLRSYLNDTFVPNESITISTATGATSIETLQGTLQMLAEVSPFDATLQNVHWTVSNSGIATINQDGLLTAVDNGEVTVKAQSLELGSNVSDEMVITITGQPEGTVVISGNTLRIYPNPSDNGLVTIDGLNDISSIVIMDVNGKQLQNHSATGQSVTLNTGLGSGLYIIRISDATGVYYKKYVIR